jgi:hypothetical protein
MDWDDPLDPVAITVDEVLSGERVVVLVRHDAGHGGWQFYDGEDVTGRTPAVVPKNELLRLDGSLAKVTDLPVGWLARRAGKGQPWVRQPLTAD